MPLRIRCPECKTVQDVPAGARPTCPKCGFAGHGRPKAQSPPPKAQTGVKFTRVAPAAAPAAAAAPQAQQVEWAQPEAEWPAEPAADEWAPVDGEAPPAGWPQQEDEWPAEADEWAEQPAAETPPPAAPPKKGWFGRGK